MISWSLSRLQVFEKCPAQFYHLYIAKDHKQQQNAYGLHGAQVHDAFENYLKTLAELPDDLKPYQDMLQKLLAQTEATKGRMYTEQQYAFDMHWSPVDWFDKEKTWLRCKNDVTIVAGKAAVTIDWKTGKQYGNDNRQLMLVSAATMVAHEQVDTVEARYYYLQTNKMPGQKYTRDKLLPMLKMLTGMYTPILIAEKANEWSYTPSKFACGYCPVNPENGGNCRNAAN